MNQSPPAHPLPIGTRVMYVGPRFPEMVPGTCGITVGALTRDAELTDGWGYHVRSSQWLLLVTWRCLVPIAPPDEKAEPREVEAPAPEAVPA